VSNVTGNITSKVLHIRPEPSGSSADDMDARLASASLQVSTCGDVYRGLSRLCLSGPDDLRAVIVCVDGLVAADFEFFAIASRMYRGVPVYVYGRQRSTSQIARAIEVGAAEQVTEDIIAGLAARVFRPTPQPAIQEPGPRPGTPAVSAPPPVPTEPPEAPRRDSDIVERSTGIVREGPLEESDHQASGGVEPDDAADATPVPVPWLRHHERPVRRGPGRREPTAAEQSASEAATPTRRLPTAPLLTDEELQALMGDDIAAIAPDVRTSASADDSDRGEDLP
jgi:hypothetical protein